MTLNSNDRMIGHRQEKGPRYTPASTSFTLFSRHAEAVELCLFDRDGEDERERVELTATDDGEWRARVEGIRPGQLYGFRVHGPFDPPRGHRFNSAKLLVDPRAAAVNREPSLDDAFSGEDPADPLLPDRRDTGAAAPKSIVVDPEFDWADDARLEIPWRDTVIYECHVRGTSLLHPDVPEELRGTYLGLCSEPILEYLVRLGVTAVELLPVHQIASEPHLLENGLTNYFGYSPLAFFAPHAGYACDPHGGQVAEFKQMVKALHAHGLEVILDVVFNHTAEGGHRGRTLSLRGVDNRSYYRLAPDDLSRYRDFTGCGNTIAADNPAVTAWLVDCLRYWVEEMHVDGFRFDLAVALGRTDAGFTPDAPFFTAVASEPALSNVKLIAEPWDLGTDGYQPGRFPAGWLHWNDRFRDTVRRAWRGDPHQSRELRRVFAGEADPVTDSAHRGRASIHFITCHDGFTLEDLVTYEHKHNWGNHEGNRDGSDHNLSRNWGVEGPTESAVIRAQREQAKRNMLATTLLSVGVPMLLHGDESNRTQHGNNNAYCQDNELNWLDWSPNEGAETMQSFTAEVLALRKKLRPLDDARPGTDREWITAIGGALLPTDDRRSEDPFGVHIQNAEGSFLVLFNPASRNHLFRLPRAPGRVWSRILSTAVPDGSRELRSSSYRLCRQSMSVLELLPARD